MEWRGWPNNMHSPYVLPCRIWSFCVKVCRLLCRHKYTRNPNIGKRWNSAVLEWGVADTKIHAPPPRVTTLNLVVLRQRVHINRRESQNLATPGPCPLCYGRGWPKEIRPFPTSVIMPNLVVLGQMVWALLSMPAWKIWPLASRLSRSFKVIGTDTDRSATYDFLLTFHSNQWPISCCFRDKRRFSRKSQIFPPQCIWRRRWRGSPWKWVSAHWIKELEWWCYRAEKEVWRYLQSPCMSSFFLPTTVIVLTTPATTCSQRRV